MRTITYGARAIGVARSATGSGKCKDATKPVLSVLDYRAPDGQSVYEARGVVDVPGAGLYDVVATVEAATGKSRGVIALPIVGQPLNDMNESQSDVERMVGEAVASHFTGSALGPHKG
jgi:hypothetical protein